MGHSMGGHGALISYLKNPGKYSSVSAFSPICNPTQSPWGQKAFEGYLGSVEAGKEYDATELISKYEGPKYQAILIDQVILIFMNLILCYILLGLLIFFSLYLHTEPKFIFCHINIFGTNNNSD